MIKTYCLAASSNSGRFALGEDGDDLTSGECIAILLGEHWIPGRVEGAPHLIPIERNFAEIQQKIPMRYMRSTYYFIASDDGNICALCVGMRVRLR